MSTSEDLMEPSGRSTQIRLWAVPLPPTAPPDAFGALSAEEHGRMARYRLPDSAREFGLTRAALRRVLGRLLVIPPSAVRLDTVCTHCSRPHGPPRLPETPGLSISVSHTRHLSLIAVGGPGPIGIDIESVEAASGPAPSALSAALNAREREEVSALPPHLRRPFFRDMWVCKEAYAKALTLGLGLDFRTVELRTRGAVTLAGAPGRQDLTVTRFSLNSCDDHRRWTAALAAPRAFRLPASLRVPA